MDETAASTTTAEKEKGESENEPNNDEKKDSIKAEPELTDQAEAEPPSNIVPKIEDIKSETNESNEEKMDIKNESSTSTFDTTELEKEPVFAEICSFFNMFAAYLNMKPLSFVKLEKMFSSTEDEVSHDLIDLHLTLLRKIGYKSARFDKWESFLQKFLIFNKDEEIGVQLERLGYANLPLTTKLEILFQLCGRQFDFNLKFKENIFNTLSPFELRFAPIGKDRNGLSYWYQRDHDLNVRVYTEEPEDDSGSTWSLIARSHSDIIKLIEKFKKTDFGQIKEENDEDVDESQILDRSTDSKKSLSNGSKKKAGEETLPPNFWKLLKPEVAEKYYKYLDKRNTFKDVYRDGSDLNKRKNEKLQKKEAKANGAAAATSSQTPATSSAIPKTSKAKSEEKEEENNEEEEEMPEIPPELLEDRRILPRRSARSNAMTNIKSFTTPTRKKNPPAAAATPVEEKKKDESEEESSEDGDDMEEDDDDEESDRSFGKSDEEFNLPSKKGKAGKARKPRRQRAENDDGDTPPKPKKKKKKVATIAFEDSSDEEEEQQEIKEKRKATALTLCMQCHKSSKPDVLLLCDMCDDAWHTFCLKPPLHYVPDDDWFCPQCHHAMLVDRFVKIEEELKEALKVKEADESKKMQAAERLKREMEYIGVSLNNIIPSANAVKQDPYQSMSESTESEDDGQRKSKKKAMKKVMRHSRKKEREREQYFGPVVTVAEGRSRRSTKKVDYNFSAYDEQLQEAMDVIDEPGVKTKYENDHRPAGGLGRGKDMATIEDAQRKRSHDSEDFEDENDEPVKKKKKQKSKKLTDLDIDNATESEDDEYQASENEEEDPEPSEDDYVPSDIERQSKRRGRRRSDAEFIDDDESDEEYNPSGRKKKGRQVLRRSGGRKKRKAWDSDDEEESDAGDYQDESSDDGYRKKRKKAAPPPKKRAKKRYSDEEEDEEEEVEDDNGGESSDSAPKKKTARGRPMRKAAAKAVLKESDDEEVGDLDADQGAPTDKAKNESRPVGAISRKLEEDEFKPDDEDDEEEEEEEEEEVDENDDEEESEDMPDTGEDEDSRPAKNPPKRKAPTPPPVIAKKNSPSKAKREKKVAEVPKTKEEEKPIVEAKKEISPPVKAPTPASNPPSNVSTPKPAPTPPRQQILVAPTPQQASLLMQQLPTSSPGPNPLQIRPPLPQNGFLPYSTPIPMQQHPNAIRFAVQPPPHSLYAAPPGGYYGPPPMTYGQPPPILPTYVMQGAPPPQYGMPPPSHGFLPSNLTMLEPLQTMHHHIPASLHQQSNLYGGLQPIQHSQPSDSDGLAQAIAGAMNSDL